MYVPEVERHTLTFRNATDEDRSRHNNDLIAVCSCGQECGFDSYDTVGTVVFWFDEHVRDAKQPPDR